MSTWKKNIISTKETDSLAHYIDCSCDKQVALFFPVFLYYFAFIGYKDEYVRNESSFSITVPVGIGIGIMLFVFI
jgi:hypothetical protein